MSKIDDAFVTQLAKIWHGIELDAGDAATLAGMLAPMDDAGEALATQLQFEMEPSRFIGAMKRESNGSASPTCSEST